MKTTFVAVTLAVVVSWRGAVYGAGSDAVLDLLLKKGVITTQEVQEVKAKLDAEMATMIEQYQKPSVAKRVERMTFSGDLRLRAEVASFEPGLHLADRTAFRFRLRFGVESKFTDWAMVGFRMISGDGNPVAPNQTFTDTFTKKPINIDLAYAALQLPDNDTLRVLGGKMPIPIWQPAFYSPIVYDPDVTPEGVAEQVNYKFGDKQQHRIFVQLGQYTLQEFANDSNDAYVFDFLGGVETKLPGWQLTAAGGYYLTHNLGLVKVGASPNLGNATTVSGSSTNFVADYHVVYARGQAVWTIRDQPVLSTPCLLTFSGEYAKNLADEFKSLSGATTNISPDQTDAWTVQVMFGEAKKKGQWLALYQFKSIEADATWDAISDSDFGRGSTDREGHAIRAVFMLQDWWQISFNSTITEKISHRPNTGHNNIGVQGETLLRVQADSTFRF